MTTKTVGATSRDYATVTLWQAAFPGGTGTWDGQMYNDAPFLNESVFGGATLTIGGTSTCPETLQPASGQSAFDNNTNPLKYDQSKGVAIVQTGVYTNCLIVQGYCTVTGIQFSQSGAGASSATLQTGFTYTGIRIDRCLFYQTVSGSGFMVSFQGSVTSASQILSNSVLIVGNASLGAFHAIYSTGVVLANNTFVSPSNLSNTQAAITTAGGATKITNNAMFGFTTAVNVVSGTPTGTNNATDVASIGFTSASSLTSQTYVNQFTGITTTGGLDYRLKAGTTIGAGTGATDTTDIPGSIDIFNTARGTSWSIGAYQPVGAPPVTAFRSTLMMMGMG